MRAIKRAAHLQNANANANDSSRYTNITFELNNGRALSAERRKKISESLKGRRLSEAHRSKLSKRFTGKSNPRYGHTLSEEERAKISEGMARSRRARIAKNDCESDNSNNTSANICEESIAALREKALSSRLFNVPRNAHAASAKREATAVEALLQQVRKGRAPPEAVLKSRSVVRSIRTKTTNGERMCVCEMCNGSGFMPCKQCVNKFGVISQRCTTCAGAGAQFCESCSGAGVASSNGVRTGVQTSAAL